MKKNVLTRYSVYHVVDFRFPLFKMVTPSRPVLHPLIHLGFGHLEPDERRTDATRQQHDGQIGKVLKRNKT